MLEQPAALHATAALYRSVLDHDVYFRPTGDGMTVLSLNSEERASTGLIRQALREGLALPGDLLFLCQEWRLPLVSGRSGKLDVLAVDPAERRLVVVELKSSEVSARRGGTPGEQAVRYAEWIHSGRDYFMPFFGRMLRAMAVAYDGPEEAKSMQLRENTRPATRVLYATGLA